MSLPPRTSPSPSGPVRLGLDVGSSETRIALRKRDRLGRTTFLTLPTLVGYQRPLDGPLGMPSVGRRATFTRHRMRLLNPLHLESEHLDQVLYDFASYLEGLCHDRGGPRLWGVVACSAGADPTMVARKRAIANEIFERTSFVDDAFLLALGLDSERATGHSIIVDVGYTSVRCVVMRGEVPTPEDVVEIPFGGKNVDEELRLGLALRYPELVLTDYTLVELKERLSFVAPVQRRAQVRIWLRGAERTIDVTDIVHRATDKLIPPILKAIRQVLARSVSDEVEVFLKNIVLSGGGSEVTGLAQRVREELQSDGFDEAVVRRPANSTLLVARGALRWAELLDEAQWGIPLFSFHRRDAVPAGRTAGV